MVHALLEKAIDVHLLHELTGFHEVVAYELGQILLAQPPLHGSPKLRVDGLVLCRRQSHEEVVPYEVRLRQRPALAIEALEDSVRVIVVVEDDATKVSFPDTTRARWSSSGASARDSRAANHPYASETPLFTAFSLPATIF